MANGDRPPHDIGHMDGRWIQLFKLSVSVLLPAIVALQTWQVGQIYSLARTAAVMEQQIQHLTGDGIYSVQDAKRDQDLLKAEIVNHMATNFPPLWLKEELQEIKNEQSSQREVLRELERNLKASR